MTHAYPADELIPPSGQGCYWGFKPRRGNTNDMLGNFSITFVNTVNTLALLVQLDNFEKLCVWSYRM